MRLVCEALLTQDTASIREQAKEGMPAGVALWNKNWVGHWAVLRRASPPRETSENTQLYSHIFIQSFNVVSIGCLGPSLRDSDVEKHVDDKDD